MRHLMFALGVFTAAGSVGCGGSTPTSATSTTTPAPTVVVENFNGTIGQGGTMVHNFTVNNSGYTLLAGFTSISPSTITALGIGIGSWDPTSQTCGLNLTENLTAKTGSTAISGTAGSGSFCVRVFDGGNVTDPSASVSYTVQVQHY